MVTLPDEERDRLVSYITHQGAKEPAAIAELVGKGHGQLLDVINGLAEAQARFKPAPDVWSVLEVLEHVVGAKKGTARVCQALAGGETLSELPRGEAGALPSLPQARSELAAAHDELLGFLAGLSSDANVEKQFEHPVFGPLNCKEWAAFQRVHDGDHAQQIEQVRAAPGFPAA